MSEKAVISRNGKDGVFCDYFRHAENVMRLYRVLHPEDHETSAADIDIVTLTNTLVNGPYNDLGFMAGGRLLVLVEAQTTWSVNIAARCLIYLGQTYEKYISANRVRIYDAAPVKLPRPELYVIYTKERGDLPDTVSFARDLLGLSYPGESAADVTVKVLYKSGTGDIIDQYIEYTEIFDEQVKAHGYTAEAAYEIVRKCMEQGIMGDYFSQKEARSVVFDYMDNVRALELKIEDAEREGEERGRAEERETAAQKVAREYGIPIEKVRAVLAAN